MNMLALLIAIAAAWLLAPYFDTLIGTDAGSFSLPLTWALGFGGIFFTGALLSGLYPAFVLSGYHPITVLKGLFKNSTRGQSSAKA
jgi:putative ABC transport system permease protein